MMLEIENLSLQINETPLISDFNLSVSPGDRVVITGESGKGKTSILYSILNQLPGALKRSNGRIYWKDADQKIEQSSKDEWNKLLRTKIGFIPQDVFGAWDPTQKIKHQILGTVAWITKRDTNELSAELIDIIQKLGISEPERLLDSYSFQLSGGQLQRLLIAFSILKRPSLLLMDEPTSALDQGNQSELIYLLQSLSKQRNIALIITTHDFSLFKSFTRTAVHLDDSHIRKEHTQKSSGTIHTDIVLEFADLVYTYPNVSSQTVTIGPISCTLKRSGVLMIIGPSGSGKSSVSNMLTGWIKPDNGTLTCQGNTISFKDKRSVKFLRTQIQIVPQDGRGALHPAKSIRTLLLDVGIAKGEAIPDDRLYQFLKDVELPQDTLDKMPGQLSGGECLRVCICRALLFEPAILICDESTTGLDTKKKYDILQLLDRLRQERSLSLIMITHDPEVAMHLGGDAIILEEGKVLESGPVSELKSSGKMAPTKTFFNI